MSAEPFLLLDAPLGIEPGKRRPWGLKRERVLLRDGAGEVPYTLGDIRVLRWIDGRVLWRGVTDAAGWYEARHLELQERHVSVAIDVQGLKEATAAGPWLPELDPAMVAKGLA